MEIIRTPEMIAGEINTIKDQVRNTAIMASVEIGRRLKEAKGLVPEGMWMEWLEENVDYSLRTAQNLMALAAEYDAGHGAALENMSYTKAVLLLGVPRYEREEFVAEHDVESMSTRELKQTIADLQDQLAGRQMDMQEMIEEQNAEEAQRLEEENQELRKRLEESKRDLSRSREERSTVDKEVKTLKDQLVEARAQNARDAVDAGKERVKLENEIAALKTELKKARDEAQAPAPAPEIEKEMQSLREKLSRGQDEQALRAGFDSLKIVWSQLKDKLSEVEKTDQPTAAKYRAAFARAMRIMADQAEGKA